MAPDTGTIDLSRVEAERRRLEAVTDEIVEITVPDDASTLFADVPTDDSSAEQWARRIVADVLHDHEMVDAVLAPVADPQPVERPVLGDDHLAYWAILDSDQPLALLPGSPVVPDGAPWRPVVDRSLERLADRVVRSFRATPATAAATAAVTEGDWAVDWSDDDAGDLAQSTARTIAWGALAVVWLVAAFSLTPFMLESGQAAVDFSFDIWGR